MSNRRRRFVPDWHDKAAMRRGRVMLVEMVALLAAMIGGLNPNNRIGINAARRMMRVAESCARRWLVARARLLKPPVVRMMPAGLIRRFRDYQPPKQYEPCDVRYRPPPEPAPRFSLAEPLAGFSSTGPVPWRPHRIPSPPPVRIEQHGVLTVRIHSTAGQSVPDRDGQAHAQLVRRLAALRTVTDHPARQARRMARWLAREDLRRHGRTSPLRPGRAPGQVRDRRRRTREQSVLSDLSMLADHALWPPDTS